MEYKYNIYIYICDPYIYIWTYYNIRVFLVIFITRTSKACKHIALSELCDIFFEPALFLAASTFPFQDGWTDFFRNWQFTWVFLLQRTFWAPESATWFRLRPFVSLVLSIASFWLVGCSEWLCTNVPALLTKQITHECNIEKHEKDWTSAFARRKKAFFPSENAFFSRWNAFIFEGHKPLPWENQSNLRTDNGSLDKPHSNSLALSNGRMILNSESATKFCQINCVAVSIFYILFLWGWRARIKSRIPRNDLFFLKRLKFPEATKIIAFSRTAQKKQTMRM